MGFSAYEPRKAAPTPKRRRKWVALSSQIMQASDGVKRSIRIATGENGVDMEHFRLSIRRQENPPASNPYPVVAFELSRQGPHARVKKRLLSALEIMQGSLDSSASRPVDLEVLLLSRRLDLNPPAHRASCP